MLKDIQEASESIYLHQFLIGPLDTKITQRLIKSLHSARSRGIQIHTIVDAMGSWKLMKNLKNHPDTLLRFYIKPRILPNIPLPKQLFRDHRKLLVIDQDIVHIGGVVFYQEAQNWWDLHARFKDAPIAQDAITRFEHTEKLFFGGPTPKKAITSPSLFIEQRKLTLKGNYIRKLKDYIKQAKHRIVIVTPYLSPPRSIVRLMKKAVQRGVCIEIIIPKETDSPIAQIVNTHYVHKFRNFGIQVYLLPKMNHAKALLIDDWGTFGSINFDRLSLRLNYEMNIMVSDEELEEFIKVLHGWKSKAQKFTDPKQQPPLPSRVAAHILKYIV